MLTPGRREPNAPYILASYVECQRQCLLVPMSKAFRSNIYPFCNKLPSWIRFLVSCCSTPFSVGTTGIVLLLQYCCRALFGCFFLCLGPWKGVPPGGLCSRQAHSCMETADNLQSPFALLGQSIFLSSLAYLFSPCSRPQQRGTKSKTLCKHIKASQRCKEIWSSICSSSSLHASWALPGMPYAKYRKLYPWSSCSIAPDI